MLVLNTESNIGTYKFDFVETVEIRSSWDRLTDTCTFTLPNKIAYTNIFGIKTQYITGRGDGPADNTYPAFLPGYDVSLRAGYGKDTPVLFTGFLASVSPNLPVKFEMQDPMYWLKASSITDPVTGKDKMSRNKIELKTLLTEILESSIIPFDVNGFGGPGSYKLDVVDGIIIGAIRITDSTIAEVLSHLKKQYGLVSWFRGETLHVGLAYLDANPTQHRFDMEENVISNDALEYRSEDATDLYIKVISIFPDNTRAEVFAGKKGGEIRTYYQYDVPESSLQQIADEYLTQMNYEGYRGHFTAFLQPTVQHGDIVKLSDPKRPERQGDYLVKEVTTTYGVNGGRQDISIDRKVS